MATTKLGLPTVTSNMSADVPRDLNALAEAVDAKVGVAGGLGTLGADGILIPAQRPPIPVVNDGTTMQKGIVQLEDSTTSASTTKAATPNSVKTAMDRADAAFQSASDGKTRIANAAGVPSVSSDTFTKIASDITTGKTKIKTSVEGKGGTVPSNPSFDGLADAIAGIPLGVKSATGTAIVAAGTFAIDRYDGSAVSHAYIDIMFSDLGFIPKIVFVFIKNKTVLPPTIWTYDNFVDVSSSSYGNLHFNAMTFRMPYTKFNDRLRLPVGQSNLNTEYTWLAKG